MKREVYQLCFVSKLAEMAGTMHLTADGKHTLCGRPITCVVPLTIYTLVRYRCGSCVDVAWSRDRKRLARNKKGTER